MPNFSIAVIGDSHSVMGFKALGLQVEPVSSPEEARKALHRLAKEGCAVIYLTESLAEPLDKDIARYKDAVTPAVILIPGKEGSLGIGMSHMQKAVERAVGADIL